MDMFRTKRFGNSAHVMTYDREWNAHPEYSVFNSDYLKGEPMPKPKNLEKMLDIAEKLSAGFPELRVDLYNIEPDQEDGHIYFGELTFTSQGGLMPFYTPEFLLELGSKFSIDDFPQKEKITVPIFFDIPLSNQNMFHKSN